MTAFADTLPAADQLQQDKRASHRGKRMLSGSSLSLASIRASLSQISLQQERRNSNSSQQPTAVRSPASLDHKNGKESKPVLPHLQIPFKGLTQTNINQHTRPPRHHDDEDGYFGDIADRYYHSDNDPISPSSASPTSPFTTHDWVDFRSAQPPTPPVHLNRPRQGQTTVPPRRVTPLRNNESPSVENSPMLAASAKFSMLLSSNRGSQDSLSLASSASSGYSPSSSSAPSPTMRAYPKRSAPVPSSVSPQAPNGSSVDLNAKPDLPPKDSSRPLLQTQYHNNSSSHLPLHTFPAVVMEAMKRNRSASVAGNTPSSSLPPHPFAGHAGFRERSNSMQSPPSHLPSISRDRHSTMQYLQGQNASATSIPREEQLHAQQRQHQRQHLLDLRSPMGPPSQQLHRASQQPAPSQGLTPSEMMFRRFDDQAARSLSQGSMTLASPKARKDPRKVVFGDMITIVTVERTETPPPPPADKKKKKKKMFSMGSKAGPHPDPEYDSDYYNAPYTPEPAEVVVTQAPWIGNPNYDEEKQNSSFYYDDYENDEYDQEAPEYDGEDEDYDEDEDEYHHGGSQKKKGGMFKFKRAVNRLLRN
ncbi:hypothetical protein B0O80DRAFT_449818 [Mortierella sp. GBAus27b]|nr:hypothetical protein BGX31_003378 [Mortierella sp. GBA43]KAI8354836.1 hypothetical protein B0O80DRAFT_449818 [Mortierella sp. GBAus27b]